MKTQLEIWNKSDVTLLDREKLTSKNVNYTAEHNAAQIANVLLNHCRNDALTVVFGHIVRAIQFDHPDYDYHDLVNDQNRIHAALHHILETYQD